MLALCVHDLSDDCHSPASFSFARSNRYIFSGDGAKPCDPRNGFAGHIDSAAPDHGIYPGCLSVGIHFELPGICLFRPAMDCGILGQNKRFVGMADTGDYPHFCVGFLAGGGGLCQKITNVPLRMYSF